MTTEQDIAMAQAEWDALEYTKALFMAEDEKLLMTTDWGAPWAVTEAATIRSIDIEQELKAIEAAQREIEDFLMDAGAPGWVAG